MLLPVLFPPWRAGRHLEAEMTSHSPTWEGSSAHYNPIKAQFYDRNMSGILHNGHALIFFNALSGLCLCVKLNASILGIFFSRFIKTFALTNRKFLTLALFKDNKDWSLIPESSLIVTDFYNFCVIISVSASISHLFPFFFCLFCIPKAGWDAKK